MKDSVINEFSGIKFGEEFGNRYGQPTPAFFPGSLEDALADAVSLSHGRRSENAWLEN